MNDVITTSLTKEQYDAVVMALKSALGDSYTWSVPWTRLKNGTYDAQSFYELMQSKDIQNLGYQTILNNDGTVRGYAYINKSGNLTSLGTYDEIAESFNSNFQTGTVANTTTFKQATDTALDTATKVENTGTLTKFTSGVKSTGKFITGEILPAVMAASAGIQLGKGVDGLIYNIGTAMGLNPPESLNPETWSSITSDMADTGAEGVLKTVFNTLLGINDDGTQTMYADENALAYMAYWLQTEGCFEKQDTVINVPESVKSKLEYPDYLIYPIPVYTELIGYLSSGSSRTIKTTANESTVYYFMPRFFTSRNYYPYPFACSLKPFTVTRYDETGSFMNTWTSNEKTIYNEKIYYIDTKTTFDVWGGSWATIPRSEGATAIDDCMYAILFGTEEHTGGKDGVNTLNGATVPDLSGVTDPESMLNLLKTQYPELWDNRVENTVTQPDASEKTYVYVPISMPSNGTGDAPTTTDATQGDTTIDSDDSTDDLLNTLLKFITQNQPTNMTDPETDPIDPTNPTTDAPTTGTGDTPTVTIPTGSASALYKIYNPTQSELNSFGAWLWSSDFVDQLLKLFNDPMQAIIGLHKVYCPVPVAGTSNIKVGYLDSGVSSNYVGSQYTTIDCGSVKLSEYFGNVFDYDPFTKVFIYLPFIGIEQLNTGDVMRSTISVIYHCDVLTGACLAEIHVTRDSAGGILYTYTGNCAVQYPISSGSYMGIVESMAGIGASIVGTVASGGSLAPVALGAMGAMMNAHTTVSHSGAFSGNAGAMGVKTPYLIITRPQTEVANTFPQLDGHPANYSTTVGSCSGYIEIESVHVENVPATDGELSEIEMLLKSGVIV